MSGRELEAELAKRSDHRTTIVGTLLDKEDGVLRGIGEAEKDRARVADEEIMHTVARQRIANLLGLSIVKVCGHSRATREDAPHTSAGILPSSRRTDRARRPIPACGYG